MTNVARKGRGSLFHSLAQYFYAEFISSLPRMDARGTFLNINHAELKTIKMHDSVTDILVFICHYCTLY